MSIKATKGKAIFGNHPVTEGPKNEPLYLTPDTFSQFVYPDFGTMDQPNLNFVYFSSETLTVGEQIVAPGGFFDPPDYHPGDETYFVLEGSVTQYCPETGQVIKIKEGEALLIPQGVGHNAYNFEDTVCRIIFVIAPKIVEDQLFPDNFNYPKKLVKGPSHEMFRPIGDWDEEQRYGTLDDIGRWPAEGKLMREMHTLYPIYENKKLLAIHGYDRPMLIKFSVSTDYMHVGEFIVCRGGAVNGHSETISHQGETVLIGVDGPLTVYLMETREAFVLNPRDGMYLPPNTEYRLVNYSDRTGRVLFCVGDKF